MREQMRGEFGKSFARGAAGDVLRRRRDVSGETRNVRYPDGAAEKSEHGRIVRRISGKSELLSQGIRTALEEFRKKLLRHRQLVVAAEPAVDVD